MGCSEVKARVLEGVFLTLHIFDNDIHVSESEDK